MIYSLFSQSIECRDYGLHEGEGHVVDNINNNNLIDSLLDIMLVTFTFALPSICIIVGKPLNLWKPTSSFVKQGHNKTTFHGCHDI